MVSIPFISKLYQDAKEKNVIAGIIIIDLIAFISNLIFYGGIFYYGDLQMSIGCIIGTRFALKNIKPNQSFLIYSIIVGLGGTILTAISFSLFDWMIFSVIEGFSLLLFLTIFVFFLIEAIIIGLIIGGIVGGYFTYTSKRPIKTSSADEDFYKSLEEK